jgi:predicted nucleic acid-binding protein
MILVDTGPLVALFDPQDGQHDRCVKALKGIRKPIMTTTPVLTEAFHVLGPARVAGNPAGVHDRSEGLRNVPGASRASPSSDADHLLTAA